VAEPRPRDSLCRYCRLSIAVYDGTYCSSACRREYRITRWIIFPYIVAFGFLTALLELGIGSNGWVLVGLVIGLGGVGLSIVVWIRTRRKNSTKS